MTDKEHTIEEECIYLESGFYSREELEDIIRTMDRLRAYIKDMVQSSMETKH